MTSRRIVALRKIRDALDPLYEGGCQLWKQGGSKFSVLPTATVRFETDTPLGSEVGNRVSDGTGGRYIRELSVIVDVWCQHDGECPPADPVTGLDIDQSTDEYVDEQLVKAEQALPRIDWTSVFVERSADVRLAGTSPFISIEGQPFVGGHVRALIRYAHHELNPEAA